MALHLNHRNFLQRLASAIVLIPLAVLALVAGGWYFWLFCLFFSVVATLEYYGIVASKAPLIFHAVCAVLPVIVFFLAGLNVLWSIIWIVLGIVWAVVFFLGLVTRAGSVLLLSLGPFYTILPLVCGFALRDAPNGMMIILYVLAVVWGTDIGGYLFGRMIGGPRLLPMISPNKTWAGAIGGLITASILAGTVLFFAPVSQPKPLLLFVPILSCISQLGDLLESMLKRRFGFKDSGRLIPGHGGALDRIDGLLAVSAVYSFFHLAINLVQDWW